MSYGIGSFYKYYGSDCCIYQDEIYDIKERIRKVKSIWNLYKNIPNTLNDMKWRNIVNYWQFERSIDELFSDIKQLFSYYETSVVMFGMKNNIIPEDVKIDYKKKKYYNDENVWSLTPQITSCFEAILTICIPESIPRNIFAKKGINFEDIENLILWYKFILEKKQEEMDKEEYNFNCIIEDLETGKNSLERYTDLYPRELLM